MCKPKRITEALWFILSFMGGIFVVFGILIFIGVLTPSENSSEFTDVIFISIGCLFSVFGTIFGIVNIKTEKNSRKLIENNDFVIGQVENIRRGVVKYNSNKPWIIYFTYIYDGTKYKGKSDYFWQDRFEKAPKLCEVKVFIDKSNPNKYVCSLS